MSGVNCVFCVFFFWHDTLYMWIRCSLIVVCKYEVDSVNSSLICSFCIESTNGLNCVKFNANFEFQIKGVFAGLSGHVPMFVFTKSARCTCGSNGTYCRASCNIVCYSG